MTTNLPRPSMVGNRPAYLDNLYNNAPATPSAHSSTSSISCSSTASNYDLRSAYNLARRLSPAFEEDQSDTFSVRSKKSFMKRRRFGLGSLMNRRTYPQSDDLDVSRPGTSQGEVHPAAATTPSSPRSPPTAFPTSNLSRSESASPQGRRPSLPKIQTNFPPPRAVSTYAKRPLPAVPGAAAGTAAPTQSLPKPQQRPPVQRKQSSASGAELSCQRCYYYAARNCQGYVLGGEAGDPCETCLVGSFTSSI